MQSFCFNKKTVFILQQHIVVTTGKNALQFSRCIYYSAPDLPGKILTLDDLHLLLEELLDVKWYHLGLQLNFRVEKLDDIRVHFSNPRDQLLEMLKTWLTTGDNPSWKSLTDALSSRSVGASHLAGLLEAKYGRPKDMHESKH